MDKKRRGWQISVCILFKGVTNVLQMESMLLFARSQRRPKKFGPRWRLRHPVLSPLLGPAWTCLNRACKYLTCSAYIREPVSQLGSDCDTGAVYGCLRFWYSVGLVWHWYHTIGLVWNWWSVLQIVCYSWFEFRLQFLCLWRVIFGDKIASNHFIDK